MVMGGASTDGMTKMYLRGAPCHKQKVRNAKGVCSSSCEGTAGRPARLKGDTVPVDDVRQKQKPLLRRVHGPPQSFTLHPESLGVLQLCGHMAGVARAVPGPGTDWGWCGAALGQEGKEVEHLGAVDGSAATAQLADTQDPGETLFTLSAALCFQPRLQRHGGRVA